MAEGVWFVVCIVYEGGYNAITLSFKYWFIQLVHTVYGVHIYIHTSHISLYTVCTSTVHRVLCACP